MKDKKRFICFAVIAALLVALIVTMMLVPIATVRTYHMDYDYLITEASGTFSLLTFTKTMPYLTEFCYKAEGPVWLSILAVSFNWLVVIGAVILLGFIIFELCTPNKGNWILKKNVTVKKLALTFGYLLVGAFAYEIIAFGLTTALGEGYFIYLTHAEMYISAAIAVGILVCAYLSGKKNATDQAPSKVRDSVGFAIAGTFAALFFVFVFVPAMSENMSFWDLSGTGNVFEAAGYPWGASYFIGASKWIIILMGIPVGFVLVYSIIGFIRSLHGKSINWLSSRLKRWSMALLIYSFVYLFMMIGGIICDFGAFAFEGVWFINFVAFLMVLLPYVPYIMSTTISYNKKPKEELVEKTE